MLSILNLYSTYICYKVYTVEVASTHTLNLYVNFGIVFTKTSRGDLLRRHVYIPVHVDIQYVIYSMQTMS